MPFFSIPLLYSISLVAAVWVSLCIQLSFESPTRSSQSTDVLSSLGLKLFDLSSGNLLHFYSDKPGYVLTHLRNQITLPILNEYKKMTQLQKQFVVMYAEALGTVNAPTFMLPNRQFNVAESVRRNDFRFLPFFFEDENTKTTLSSTYLSIQHFFSRKTLPVEFQDLVVANAQSGDFSSERAFIEHDVIMIDLKYNHHFRLAYKPLLSIPLLQSVINDDAQRAIFFTPKYAPKSQALLVLRFLEILHAYMQLHATELIVQALYDSNLERMEQRNSAHTRHKRPREGASRDFEEEQREEAKRKRNTTHK